MSSTRLQPDITNCSNALHSGTAAVAETAAEAAPEIVKWQLPKSTPRSRPKTSPEVLEPSADEAFPVADSGGATPRPRLPLQQVSYPAARATFSALPPPLPLPSPRVAGCRTLICDEKEPAATDISKGFHGGNLPLGGNGGSDTGANIGISSLHRCDSDEGCGGSRGAGGEDSCCTGNKNSGGGEVHTEHHNMDPAEDGGHYIDGQQPDPRDTFGLEG